MADDMDSKGARNDRALRHPETNYGNEKVNRWAEVLYGNPGGSPADPGNIQTALSATSRPLEEAARGDRNLELAGGIRVMGAALGKEMLALGFSDNAAKELSALLGEYHSRPRDEGEVEKNLDKALEKLSTEWGGAFSARFEDANRIMGRLISGNPGLTSFVHSTGLSSDVRFIRLMGDIAKHQPVAQAEKRGQEQAAAGQRSLSDRRRSSIADALYGKRG